MIRYCTDATGFEGLLVKGRAYRVRLLPLGALGIGPFVFHASRFSKVAP